jgi:putative DNA primase/helicase
MSVGRSRPRARPSLAILHRIDPSAPFDVARLFLIAEFTVGQRPTLYHHRGSFYVWNGVAYVEIARDDIRAKLYQFLDGCRTGTRPGEKVKPNQGLVNSVFDALAARAQLDSSISPPAWLDGGSQFAATDIIVCTNGLLHLPNLQLLSHAPAFFTHNAVDFAFSPNAPSPNQWLEFLQQLWPNDLEAIGTLREIFGYCLTSDTSQQKAFLLVGPPRSGKGTIAKVLERLVGSTIRSTPPWPSLAETSGLPR